jgi:hypothetical protein
VLLGSTTLIPVTSNQGSAFLGVVSSLPIVRLHFNEDSNGIGDDIGVRNFRFKATTAENDPPVANAGADQTVDEGALVTLDGSGSSDPEGGVSDI